MKGVDVKEKLKKEGFKLKDIAQNLGFANDQRLHSALKSDNVSSGLLENIAKATNKTVGWFYNEEDTTATGMNENNVLDAYKMTIDAQRDTIDVLKEKVADLEDRLDKYEGGWGGDTQTVAG